MSTTLSSIRRHAEYYFPGGDVVFLVEDTLFRVHKHFFIRDSHFFRKRLAHPASPGMPTAGTSDMTALVLDEVSPEDFANFLWIFYNPTYSLYHAPSSFWLKTMELAHKWAFLEVKNLAARELKDYDDEPVEKIVLFHRYEVDCHFLVPSYIALCSRAEPLSLTECEELGIQTVHRIFTARERAKNEGTFDEDSWNEIVSDVFGIQGTPTPQKNTRGQTDRMVANITMAPAASTESHSRRGDRRDDDDALKRRSSLDHSAVHNRLEIEIDDAENIVDKVRESSARGCTRSAQYGRTTTSAKTSDDDREIHQTPEVVSGDGPTYSRLLHGDDSRKQGVNPMNPRSPSDTSSKDIYDSGDASEGESDPIFNNDTGRPSTPQEDRLGSDENSTLVSEDGCGEQKSEVRSRLSSEFTGALYGSAVIRFITDNANGETTRDERNPSKFKRNGEWRRNVKIVSILVLNEDGDEKETFEDEEYFASPDSPYPDPDSFGPLHFSNTK